MTNDELRANLLADPATAELAEEQEMTVEEYITATLDYCEAPDKGFAGSGIAAPDCEHSEPSGLGHPSAFETCAPPRLLVVEPGSGIRAVLAPLVVRPGVIRG